MKLLDYIIIGAVAVWFIGAIIFVVRRHKQGKSCCGNCSGCNKCNKKDCKK